MLNALNVKLKILQFITQIILTFKLSTNYSIRSKKKKKTSQRSKFIFIINLRLLQVNSNWKRIEDLSRTSFRAPHFSFTQQSRECTQKYVVGFIEFMKYWYAEEMQSMARKIIELQFLFETNMNISLEGIESL